VAIRLDRSVALSAARVAAAAVVGVGIGGLAGVGFGAVQHDDVSTEPVFTARANVTEATEPSTKPAATTPAPQTTAPATAPVGVKVVSASIVPASTPAGRERNRASIRVRVTVTNKGSAALQLTRFSLRNGSARVRNDVQAAEFAGPLLQPIAPGSSATGEIRFETEGDASTLFSTSLSGVLSIGGRNVPLQLKIVTGA